MISYRDWGMGLGDRDGDGHGEQVLSLSFGPALTQDLCDISQTSVCLSPSPPQINQENRDLRGPKWNALPQTRSQTILQIALKRMGQERTQVTLEINVLTGHYQGTGKDWHMNHP